MGKRILLVDDSATTRAMLKDMLREEEFMVSTATSGNDALEILKTEQFDIIISDIEMPGLDGFGLVRKISELPGDPGVVLISSFDARAIHSAKELALAYSINLLGTLGKPIDRKALLDILTTVAKTRQVGAQAPETLLSETEFMRGLMTDGLAPIFQPKVDLKTGKLAGVEAFARWVAPHGGMLGAGAIVKVAREKGYMDLLTYRMLELATKQLGEWAEKGRSVTVSVNVSTENLRKEDFADVVTGLVDQYNLAPAQLILEVNESDMEVDDRLVQEMLSRLHLRGFSIALDDFGTGFAPLMRLSSIPFDEMVIDRTFIGRASEDHIARAILEAAIGLSQKLKLKCTCEGVENAETLQMVKDLGADVAQGFHIGKPMTALEFEMWMDDFQEGMFDIEGLLINRLISNN